MRYMLLELFVLSFASHFVQSFMESSRTCELSAYRQLRVPMMMAKRSPSKKTKVNKETLTFPHAESNSFEDISRNVFESQDSMYRSLESCPALVLNADYQPLSYYPLSLWSWQDAVKAVWMDRVIVLATHDRSVRSANFELKLPSVIVLKGYIHQNFKTPFFNRTNLYLRDGYQCSYCLGSFVVQDLNFDHVLPKALGGATSWSNVVTSCQKCNNTKGFCHPKNLYKIGMKLHRIPYIPTHYELQNQARKFPPKVIHESWSEYLYFDAPLNGSA